jgi:hypothetical protein
MATNIEITFSSLTAVDTVLSITDSYTGLSYSETFKASRTTIGECAIGSFVSETAQNYQNAFNNDYNASLLYTTQLIVFPIAKLIITAVNPNTQFSIASNTTSGAVTTSIDNVTPPTVFDFTEILVNPASVGTICDDVEFSVETNEQSDNILFPINQAVSTNPFVFEYPRLGNITIEMEKDGSTILQKYRIPKLLSSYIDIQIVNTPNNASVTAVRLSPLTDNETPSAIFPLTFEYGLICIMSNIVVDGDFPVSSELITNNDFTDGLTNWTAGGGGSISVSNSQLKIIADNDFSFYARHTGINFTQGKTYKITIDIANGTNTSRSWVTIFGEGNFVDLQPPTQGVYVGYHTITGTTGNKFIDIYNRNDDGVNDTLIVNSISIKETNPNDEWDVTIGDTLIADGFVEFPTSTSSFLIQPNIVDLNVKTYRLQYEVLSTNGNNFRMAGGNSAFGSVTLDSATIGKKEIILTSNGSAQSLQFQNNNFIGTFSNIKLQQYDEEQPYQNSNSWSGIPIGDYCLAVKDNLGCEITIPFTIDAFTPNLVDYDAVLEVSKVNSLQFKENEAWANCGIRKNITNTLSYEEDVKINNRSYKQLFQQCDTIRTQIKSNYTTNEAKLVNCNGVETTITITKATENLNITDVRDGTIFIKFGNQISVQFLAGNTYDPITLAQNGSYNLNGDLMQWINIGDYINIEGAGWCYITTILPPSQVSDAYTVVTTTLNNGLFTDLDVVKITSVYNAVDYDRYEFDIDMNALNGDYYVKLNISDSTFGNKEYISEWFNVATEQECHHLIDYYNTKNNEINYATGITFRLRIPYIKNLKWQPAIDENEIYVTDTRTVLLESRIRETYEMTFMPLPTAMAQKLVLALSHDKLQIDGLNYIKNDEPEVEPYGTTNLYSVKCTIVRSDYVFDNTGGTTAGEVILGAGQTFEIDGNASGLLYIN